ncbi:Phosphoglucose isomerase [Gossypium australe]|uniref:Phosphoglucose isomerase n=1 Tax=Gossypium australe TaxID=47621 RepID=A0A5B6WSG3_9ROSI|nr:Phosphoglucose isomerase [Gossypium australe]
MFTEGLDSNVLKWVQGPKEIPYSHSSLRPRVDQITNIRAGGRNFGLPPPGKFRSGHLLETAIRVTSTTLTGDVDDDSSPASENDVTSDSEEDTVYGGMHSLDSSPEDQKITNGSRTAHRYGKQAQRQPLYATSSDYIYSDVSSSMGTLMGGRTGNLGDRLVKGNGRFPVGRDGFTEEDKSSDSASSSEFSIAQVGRINGRISRSKACVSEGYALRVPSRINVESAADKDLNSGKLHHEKFSDGDVPTAPPFSSSVQKVKQDTECIPACEIRSTQSATGTHDPKAFKSMSRVKQEHNRSSRKSDEFVRICHRSSGSARIPTFHASLFCSLTALSVCHIKTSGLGPWQAVIAYDACFRLCLHAWARGCMEAPMFLENECALLRDTFGLQQMLLQSEEERMEKPTLDLTSETAAPKPKKIVGKMKVQVHKVKTTLDPPTVCSMTSLSLSARVKLKTIQNHLSNFQSILSSRWQALKNIQVAPRLPNSSFSHKSLAYMHAGTRYVKQASGLLKIGVRSSRKNSSSYEVIQGIPTYSLIFQHDFLYPYMSLETYVCMLRLKSSAEENNIRIQPGSGETHIFFPDSLADDLIVEVQDSKGKHLGHVLVQTDKLRWWSIYREPEHEPVGKLQLCINYLASSDDNSHHKCGSVAETVAYDLVLEVAMKVQRFQQRNLQLYGSWNWLLTEFASYYGVSDVYTKLRYLSYVMDVATPTADCLGLVHELLMPVAMKGHNKRALSHQENRILGETKDQIKQILSLVFENYKSLDESSFSGIMDVFKPATGLVAPALEPAIKLYMLLHDVLSPEAQTNLCHYFQAAARKRSRRHLAETDEFVTTNNEPNFMDPVAMSIAYQKMTCLCRNIKNEILTDIEIHNQHILPTFIDLPNLSASIYSTELCNRLGAFLLACPPPGPSPPVVELVIETADFHRDLASWNISHVKGGVDAKELFHLYIMIWIQDKHQSLLESCKLETVKWSGVRTQHSTTPFIDEMYERLKETLSDYEVIICRWPEYIFVLENAISDVEKAIVEALDKQYVDVVSPLKENLTPKKFGLKYMQKLTKRTVCSYTVPDELGILLNSMKRMLDVLRPKIETQFKSWGSCIPEGGNTAPGEHLSEVTVMLRTKFRGYLQAVVEKLAKNTKLQNSTKLKRILQDSKETMGESDIRGRMQMLKELLRSTINHLHTVFETQVFIAICRWYWDQMAQVMTSSRQLLQFSLFLTLYPVVNLQILDDTFASQMQQLVGNALPAKDLEPPRSILGVRSILGYY